jgi:hypothetical protein
MNVKLLESLFYNDIMIGGSTEKENNILLKIILLSVVLFLMYYYLKNNTKTTQQTEIKNIETEIKSEVIQTKPEVIQTKPEVIIPVQQVGVADIYPALRDYDYRTYHDNLTPPRKRDDYDIPANIIYPDRFGLYTRGGPNPFKKMGFLNNKNAQPGDPYKFLTLMGRQKYYNSNVYEYYVVSTNREENIKFDLDNRREIFSGDVVKVPQLNNSEYEANIDKVLDYEYNPFIV